VEYDVPQEVVAEGIVNAIAHRDYTSNASVEVMLFSDRLEIWNPGTLPPSLTIQSLSRPHSSQPGNPLIAEPFFLVKYIEKAETGTVDIFDNCRKAAMRPPEFRLENGFFILTIWRRKRGGQPESRPGSLKGRVQYFLKDAPLGKLEISVRLGQKKVSGQLNNVIRGLLTEGFIELTLPDKPNSRFQKYRLTKKGVLYLKKGSKAGGKGKAVR
jgi:hypothetical protein